MIAPGYEPGTVDALIAKRKNTRLLEAPPPERRPRSTSARSAAGSWCRTPHHFVGDRDDWRVVTKRAAHRERVARRRAGVAHLRPREVERDRAGARTARPSASAPGQQNRVESGEIAAKKAAGRAEGGACATDAFYPFPDGIEAAAAAGVAVVIQPGGALRDDEGIAAADELGVAMVFTGERHFLH